MYFNYRVARASRGASLRESARWTLTAARAPRLPSAPLSPDEDYRELAGALELEVLGGHSLWDVTPAAGWRAYHLVGARRGRRRGSTRPMHSSISTRSSNQPLLDRLRLRGLAAVRLRIAHRSLAERGERPALGPGALGRALAGGAAFTSPITAYLLRGVHGRSHRGPEMSRSRIALFIVVVVAVLGVMVLLATVALRTPVAHTPSSTVLVFDVPEELDEAQAPPAAGLFDLVSRERETVYGLADGIRQAGDDPKIKALVMHIDGLDWGWAKLAEIREAVTDFRRSGKPVYALVRRGRRARVHAGLGGRHDRAHPARGAGAERTHRLGAVHARHARQGRGDAQLRAGGQVQVGGRGVDQDRHDRPGARGTAGAGGRPVRGDGR